MPYRADLSTVCAVAVAFFELIILLDKKASDLHNDPQKDAGSVRAVPWLDLELVCSSLCLIFTFTPLIQAVQRADRMPLWWSYGTMALSATTLYCCSVEFVSAVWKVGLTKKMIGSEYVPVVVAGVVLIGRVSEKFYAPKFALKAAAPEAAAPGAAGDGGASDGGAANTIQQLLQKLLDIAQQHLPPVLDLINQLRHMIPNHCPYP